MSCVAQLLFYIFLLFLIYFRNTQKIVKSIYEIREGEEDKGDKQEKNLSRSPAQNGVNVKLVISGQTQVNSYFWIQHTRDKTDKLKLNKN
ncbi:hypothetical protein CEN50_02950 [Fischerella thermalis CCMEE 5268]|uniref:Uncharacterized protein n=1 Tax=Fischerella thermalis CCMEE 5268 TaxID=2019662 RepID=A0A2N6KL89_9CYAN|nr:hypothetical protein CEN50_02950 [Fischerella thermalis CCMEE 5268]